MLIKTIHEMRIYMPSHAYNEIETRAGIYEDAEATVLAPLLGTKLLRRLNEYYAELPDNAIVPRYVYADEEAPDASASIDQTLPMVELLKHAQRCIVFKAEEESADIDAVSRNNSGINLVSADGYEVAGKDAMKQYKDRLWKKTHEAIDRLLIFLEELAKAPLASPQEGDDQTPDPPLTDAQKQAQEIVALWRESRYYYLADGLLINTATKMHEFVDIAENRERFVQMLPDMRFIQRNYLRTELGGELFDRLLAALRDGKLTAEEAEITFKLQELLALYTQQRSRVFKFDTTERKRIEEECIGLKRELLHTVAEWRLTHNDDGTEKIDEESVESKAEPLDCCDCCNTRGERTMHDGEPYWGDKGSVFVMPGII